MGPDDNGEVEEVPQEPYKPKLSDKPIDKDFLPEAYKLQQARLKVEKEAKYQQEAALRREKRERQANISLVQPQPKQEQSDDLDEAA